MPAFDWDRADNKGFGSGYSDAERDRMLEMYDNTLSEVKEKEVVMGTVVGITDREILLNIGFKSDGLVPASEFRDMPELKMGDEVEVYVENQEDPNGQLVLSRKKAKVITAWQKIQRALDEDLVIDGFVKSTLR